VYVCPKAKNDVCQKNIQIYKTVRTPEPAQNSLKFQSAGDFAHVRLLP